MSKGEEDAVPTGPLTEAELQTIRRIILADQRARWLWTSARTLAVWVTAIIVGIGTIKGFLVDLLSGKH